MNTPTHIAASILLWRKEPGWLAASAITAGAILPDAPMFGFYAYQKVWAQQTEREIWSSLYFEDRWQLLFDAFNSIPLLLAVVILCRWAGSRWGFLLAASALLHACCDLPVHNDDAHRHFLPFFGWRLHSPISYWDPRHHGRIFAWGELSFGIAACVFSGWTTKQTPIRIMAGVTCSLVVLGGSVWFFLF